MLTGDFHIFFWRSPAWFVSWFQLVLDGFVKVIWLVLSGFRWFQVVPYFIDYRVFLWLSLRANIFTHLLKIFLYLICLEIALFAIHWRYLCNMGITSLPKTRKSIIISNKVWIQNIREVILLLSQKFILKTTDVSKLPFAIRNLTMKFPPIRIWMFSLPQIKYMTQASPHTWKNSFCCYKIHWDKRKKKTKWTLSTEMCLLKDPTNLKKITKYH